MSKAPNRSVPGAAGTANASQSIYRFWANEQVTSSAILNSHRTGVVSRAKKCQHVLAIQDTTDLDFTSHPATTGLGYINKSCQQGIKVHSNFAVSGTGIPLGVIDQHCWNRTKRTGKRGQRRKQPIENKESYRWLQSATAAEVALSGQVQVIHVGDREADIFELFAQPRSAAVELLIRAEHNRKVQHELGYLIPTIEQAPVVGQQTLELRRNPQRSARTAQLQLRAMRITVEVPRHGVSSKPLAAQSLNALLVEECVAPNDGGPPIRWLLLTTLPIDSAQQAWQCVEWYSYRWLIERFHYTLKSGCQIEALQLQSKARLLNALATYSIVSWRLMWLLYQARLTPEVACEVILEPVEWKLLRRKFVPKSRSRKPPTLQQAVVWIAQLGGFLARKNDGPPGIKTLWRGLTKLHDLLEGVQLSAKH